MASMLRQYIAIQLVPSDCSRWPPVGSGADAVEDADVVEAEEAALEDVAALGVLAVHPPGEVEQQLLEDALEEHAVADAARASSRSCRRASAAQACTGGLTSPNAHS